MRATSFVRLGLAALLAAAAACSDSRTVTAPKVALDPSILASVTGAPAYVATGKVLHRDRPLASDLYDIAWVQPNKATTLRIVEAGITVTIPKGAVDDGMYVAVVARKGPKVYYDFYPTPFQFKKDLLIEQDLQGTPAYHDQANALQVQGGWLPLGEADVASDGSSVKIGELFTTAILPEKNKNSRVAQFSTHHFSGYILAVGCRPGAPDSDVGR